MSEREPGIYFGLPEDDYHDDDALGSSGLRKLLASGPDYWWGSKMNPRRPARSTTVTASRIFGSAVHKVVLEGRQAFEALYARRPDDAPGATPAEKGETTKRAKKALQNGETLLDGDDYDRVLIANAMIAKNPHLAEAFFGGAQEVSIFWERDGVRCKARYDCLKPRAIGDLKSIANQYEREFPAACIRAIEQYRYPLQAAHYLDGRSRLAELVRQGRVFGEHDPALLARIAEAEEWAWVWVFYQSEGAPITWAKQLSPENPLLEYERGEINRAVATYLDFRKRFGSDMWVLADPIEELDESELSSWYGKRYR